MEKSSQITVLYWNEREKKWPKDELHFFVFSVALALIVLRSIPDGPKEKNQQPSKTFQIQLCRRLLCKGKTIFECLRFRLGERVVFFFSKDKKAKTSQRGSCMHDSQPFLFMIIGEECLGLSFCADGLWRYDSMASFNYNAFFQDEIVPLFRPLSAPH